MTVHQLPTGNDTLLIETQFPSSTPEQVFSHWTQPELLARWWGPQMENEPEIGGKYHIAWPSMNWHLRGRYLEFEPGQRLVFTWKWDHDAPEDMLRQVELHFESLGEQGTKLTLVHGPYKDTPEDLALRNEHHLAGWQHFLPRLQQALAKAA